MVCCGKSKAVRRIARGYLDYGLRALFRTSGEASEKATERIATCHPCDYGTYMTKRDYVKWIKGHGVEVVRHIDDLTALPMLPKQSDALGRSLFCRLCKCWIPAKAYSKDETCPKGYW